MEKTLAWYTIKTEEVKALLIHVWLLQCNDELQYMPEQELSNNPAYF